MFPTTQITERQSKGLFISRCVYVHETVNICPLIYKLCISQLSVTRHFLLAFVYIISNTFKLLLVVYLLLLIVIKR